MGISINDLDDDDVMVALDVTQQTEQVQQTLTQPESQDTFISDFLRSKGIDDMSKINFEDDSGNLITRSWDELTKEEKYNILSTPDTEEEVTKTENQDDLTEEEILFLNYIRENKMTPNLFIQSLQGSQPLYYKIDDLSDDELYILDLEAKVGDLTDEQAAQALQIAKQNEELYEKQVNGLRKEYKEREDFKSQLEQAQIEQQQLEAYQKYQNNVINAIDNFNSVGNLDLTFEDEDKDELAQFMLSLDENGQNYLYQALQDPETLVKAAWFILNGDEAFNSVSDYFTNQIKLISQSQYKKGFEDGKKGIISRPDVVIDNKKTKQTQQSFHTDQRYNSIDELYGDD